MKNYPLLVVVSIALTLLAVKAGAEEPLQKTLQEIRGYHELVRELDYSTDVSVEISGDKELAEYADEIALAHGETADVIDDLETAWKFLNMLPDETDLSETLHALRAMQTRSVYERDGNRILISRDRGTPGWNAPLISRTMQQLNVEELEFVISLQLAYALLDQNFDTGAYWDDSMSLDQRLATRAVVDGGAVALACEYLLSDTGLNLLLLPNAEAIIEQFMPLVTYIDKSSFESIPKLLQNYISFPYLKGIDFTLAQKKTGGNKLADAAFRNLPLSTEQLMHPEKYFERRDVPIEISLADLSAEFGAGATMIREDTWGEWGLRELLRAWLGDGAEVESATEGWSGDRLQLWRTAEGSHSVTWFTTWDSGEDADFFESVLKRGGRLFSDSGPRVDIQRVGRDVVFVVGASDQDMASVLVERLWQSVKIPVISPPPVPEKPDPESLISDLRSFIGMFVNEAKSSPRTDDTWQDLGDTFRNTRYKYEVTRPNDDWHFQRIQLGGLVLSEFTAINTKELGSNFTIYTFSKYEPDAPDNPVDEMVHFMDKQMTGFKKLSEKSRVVSGFPARSVTFTGVSLMPLTITYTEVFSDEYCYVITFWGLKTNYKKLLPEFTEFIDSFHVID